MSQPEYPPDPPLSDRTRKWHLVWDQMQDIEILVKRLSESLEELADGEPDEPA